jgi:hypothetical protein
VVAGRVDGHDRTSGQRHRTPGNIAIAIGRGYPTSRRSALIDPATTLAAL